MNRPLEPRVEDTIKECIWYRCETMLAMTTSPCNTCGGYRRECAESGKYFPREDKMKMQEFVEDFVKRWNSRNDRRYRTNKQNL